LIRLNRSKGGWKDGKDGKMGRWKDGKKEKI